MTLHHASIERGLNRDWIHGDKVIAEVEMSYSQFCGSHHKHEYRGIGRTCYSTMD